MRQRSGVGAAVIGGGFVGRLHVEALRRLGIPVRGLLGSSPERGSTRAAELGLPAGYASLDDLLADPAVDVVHVASPNHLHAEQVAAILDAGRHVVCEKPLATSSSESAALLRQADASGLVHALCFNLRFYPLNLQASATIRQGGIGGVRLITGHYLQDWLLHDTDWNWRLDPHQAGDLRAVADIGSHWLDLVAFLTGAKIQAVMADLATFVPIRYRGAESSETFSRSSRRASEPVAVRSEDAATILLRFEGGARGALAISQVSAGRKNSLRYQVDGSASSIAWESEQPDQLWIGHRDRPNELMARDPAMLDGEARAATRLPAGHVEGYADTFVALFAAVYGDILGGSRSGRAAYPTIADGHEIMMVTDAVAASARTGQWTAVAREPAAAAPS